jgi:hypothetical protein
MLVIIIPTVSFASWTGPQTIISATWGTGAGQFSIFHVESGDVFPDQFGVDVNGLVVIPDIINKRIVIYNPDGTIKNTIYKPASLPALDNVGQWPTDFVLYPGGNSFVIDCNYQKAVVRSMVGRGPLNECFVDYNGAILAKANPAEVFPTRTGYIFLDNQSKVYTIYSPTGQVISTTTTKPLDLGVVTQKAVGDQQYRITVTYPNQVWSYIASGPDSYIRDNNGNLYGYGGSQMARYSACGKILGLLTIPEGQMSKQSFGPHIEPRITVLEEYGKPVVAPNGDVYTWKRTPDNYSILKWTWVDDPNTPSGPDAPTGLKATPSTTGIYLTWTASPNDPGCVTGYEVSRATSAGGAGSTVATVDKGVLKYNDTTAEAGTTYYYKVRAVSGSEYSPYSREASGKR